MKAFRNKILIVCGLIFSFFSGAAQTEYIPASFKVPGHPRLLLLRNEESGIKSAISADPVWTDVHNLILAESDNIIRLSPVEQIKIGKRLLDKSRECLRRVFFLSYAWRMSGNDKYLARAEKELLAVSAFSNWNPTHFLDVAEMTMAVAIGYDWLHEGLNPDSKRIIREAILKNGIEPSLDSSYNAFLKVTNNWNQVCNAGMAYGAIAIYEDQPELSRLVINRALQSIRLPMAAYSPDGAYPEGYGYWGYGTSFNVMFISAIEKLFKSDFGLNDMPGFLKTAGFLENMTGPSGDPFNFFDSGGKWELNAAMFWFAGKQKDPSLLWVERTHLAQGEAKKNVKDRLLPALMIWNGGLRMNEIPEPKSTAWVGHGKNPVALMRTSWTDRDAIYAAFKGGSPSVSHGHMDVGSFIMESDGVRWAMDYGNQNYESLESKKVDLWNMKQNSQRWEVFRYNNKTHNTLTINNGLQKVEGFAPITGFSASPMFMNATADLSAVYKGALANANRGVAIVNKAYVVVRDELEVGPEPSTVRWTLLTPANVKITGRNRLELSSKGKKLVLLVKEPAEVEMKTWSTDPPHDYDAPNPGTTLAGFEVKLPAGSKSVFTVLLIPGNKELPVNETMPALKNWPK